MSSSHGGGRRSHATSAVAASVSARVVFAKSVQYTRCMGSSKRRAWRSGSQSAAAAIVFGFVALSARTSFAQAHPAIETPTACAPCVRWTIVGVGGAAVFAGAYVAGAGAFGSQVAAGYAPRGVSLLPFVGPFLYAPLPIEPESMIVQQVVGALQWVGLGVSAMGFVGLHVASRSRTPGVARGAWVLTPVASWDGVTLVLFAGI